MLRIALKNVLVRKGRLLLSSLAVIAGCTFLSGVFVFSDTINASIDDLFATAFEKTDAHVRSAVVISNDFGEDLRGQIPESLAEEVRQVPGVKVADPDVMGTAVVTDPEGKVLGGGGPPQFGSVFYESESTPWELKEGRQANGPSEVVLDVQTAKLGKIEVGDAVTVSVSTQPREFTVVGIVTFAGAESTGGPTWALFDLPTAEEFVLGEPGQISSINIVGDGSRSQTEMRDDIQKLFPVKDVEVLTGKEIIDESQSDLAAQFAFFTLFLTIFAGIAIFVSSFVIYNVFKISAAQRLQENALLRAIGARSSQVTKALLVEASVVGLLGGLLGFAGGIGLAAAITAILVAAGFGFSDTSLVISSQSLLITVTVGMIVTMICATFPAIRAGRVPPLAALRDVSVDRSGVSRRRIVIGAVFAVIAPAGIALGLSSDVLWLIPGVMAMFVALISFGPVVVGPLSRVFTPPLAALRGVTGQVAGRNAARSPERTALTAAALGIGLSLLVAVSTIGSSVTDSFSKKIGDTFTGDFAVSTGDQGFGGLPASLADELNTVPAVTNAVGFGAGPFIRLENGEPKDSGALLVDPARAELLLDLTFTQGSWADVSGVNIAVDKEKADSENWGVGTMIDVAFINRSTATLTVAAIYDDDFFGTFIADRQLFVGTGTPLFDLQVIAQSASGFSEADVKAAIVTVTDKYPTAKVQTRGEFIDSQISELNGLLNFMYALLLMSVFIAVLGIVLTLLLAVYERRRELGLMRAIGTTRPQVRGSIRWEAVITAVLGVIMGTTLGLALGWIVVKALKDDGISTFSVSVPSIVIFAGLAIVFSVVAAWIPARKAAKAGILQAIATT